MHATDDMSGHDPSSHDMSGHDPSGHDMSHDAGHHHHHEQPAPDFGQHNMVALGRQSLFLSHLPMFMAPHDFQVVLEATLATPAGSVMDAYRAERETHPDDHLYTLAPESFALSSLFTPDPPARTTFKGTVFRGHLERGGEPIPELTDVDVSITRMVFAEQFQQIDRPDDLTYFLFGRDDEWFLAHVIRQPPDFDQLVEVTVDPLPSDEELLRGVEVVFLERENVPARRIEAGEIARARGHVTGAHRFLDLTVNVVREDYFEEGELSSMEGSFEPTSEEERAGFGG